jgi:hypothetical protein
MPPCSPTSYRVQMCECARLEIARASRLKRSRLTGSPDVRRQDLDGDVRSRRVSRAL